MAIGYCRRAVTPPSITGHRQVTKDKLDDSEPERQQFGSDGKGWRRVEGKERVEREG